ncbi:DUF4870 domain-containing protein [Bacteroidota bacterium]
MTESTTETNTGAQFTPEEIEDGKGMAILAWIFWIIPLLAARDKRFAMFHTQQALALWITIVVIYIAMWILTMLVSLISDTLTCIISILMFIPWIVFVVFWIMGLITAIQGKAKELPIIGKFGSKFNFVK